MLTLANIILPTAFGHVFSLVFVVWLVIALEAIVVNRRLQLPYGRAYAVCTKANLRSTFIGIPLAWITSFILYVVLSSVDTYIPHNASYFKVADTIAASALFYGGIIFTDSRIQLLAPAFLLIPYYYFSVFIEKRSLQKSLPEIDPIKILNATKIMNLISYGIIGIITLAVYYLIPEGG